MEALIHTYMLSTHAQTSSRDQCLDGASIPFTPAAGLSHLFLCQRATHVMTEAGVMRMITSAMPVPAVTAEGLGLPYMMPSVVELRGRMAGAGTTCTLSRWWSIGQPSCSISEKICNLALPDLRLCTTSSHGDCLALRLSFVALYRRSVVLTHPCMLVIIM
jgi:hypothetical protein